MVSQVRELETSAQVALADFEREQPHLVSVVSEEMRPALARVLRAIQLVKLNLEQTEQCYFCDSPLSVTAKSTHHGIAPTRFVVSCKCGKSNSEFNGI